MKPAVRFVNAIATLVAVSLPSVGLAQTVAGSAAHPQPPAPGQPTAASPSVPQAQATTPNQAPAQKTEPNGLQGNYLGVLFDANQLPESAQSFLNAGNQPMWILNQAVGQYQSSTSTAKPASDQQTAASGSQFQGRVDLANNPLSIRGTVFVGANANAVLPTLSYDLPLGKSTNLYAGAGYAIVNSNGSATPLGNQNGMVVTTGVEASLDRRIVVYGDAKLPLNGVSAGSNPKVQVQFGAGFRF